MEAGLRIVYTFTITKAKVKVKLHKVSHPKLFTLTLKYTHIQLHRSKSMSRNRELSTAAAHLPTAAAHLPVYNDEKILTS